MSSAVIVAGSNYEEGARRLAETLAYPFVSVKHKMFPDGERYLRILEHDLVSGRVAVVVNTMYPNQNDSFLETLMLINASIKAGASKVIAYIPYLAYARQDKVFQPGEPVSADIVVSALKAVSAYCILAVDVHNPEILSRNIECYENILVFDELYRIARRYVENPVVIAPDLGALHRAKYIAERENIEYDYLVKYRDRETGEIVMKPKQLNVEGRDVVIVDDIISTGGTIVESVQLLLKQGARRVIVCATHGLMVGNALERLASSGVYKVVLADTLGIKHHNPLVEYVDVTTSIAKVLAKYAH